MDWVGTEKRKFIRATFPCKILIHTPQKHTIVSHTENIGVGGVRVVIDENLNISSFVGLEIIINGAQIICKGRIVWVVEKSGRNKNELNIWDTGIEFYEIAKKDKKIITNYIDTIISGQK